MRAQRFSMAGKKKAGSKPASPSRARASWRGMIRFGLVSFPCEAFNAHPASADHIALHQLHAECHSRVQYEKNCPIHGPIDNDEIVSGYEFSKGRYVEIDPEELDALRTQEERALTIDAFVEPSEIDPIYFDGRMYFLSPDGDQAREPYTVFLQALRKQERWGVGQVVMSGKDQLVLLRPYQDALHMALLNYEHEIRDPAKTVSALAKVPATDKKVKLAEQLVASWTDDKFDFSTYKDTYNDKMKALIDAKVRGEELVTPEVEDEPEVVNLMEALRKSLHHTGKSQPITKPRTVRSKTVQPKTVHSAARKTSGTRRRRVS